MKFFKRDEQGRFVSKKAKWKMVGFISFVVLILGVGHFYVEPALDKAIEEAKKVQAALTNEVVAYADTVEVRYIEKNEIPPIMQRIADCESGEGGKEGTGKQFLKNGRIVQNHNTDGTYDLGKWQINFERHFDEIVRLKLDVLTEAGNQAYAMYLYENRGTGDWMASAKCWRR